MSTAVRSWVAPGRRVAIVLGRSQWELPVVSGLPVRRRASGGGAMLDGPWQLRALVRLPRDHPQAARGPAPLARWIGRVHAEWLASRGVPARLHEGRVSEHWACFAGRGPGEVLVGDRKLVGIAQAWRRSSIAIEAATLLRTPPWPLLCDAFAQPAASEVMSARTTSLEECLGTRCDAIDWAASLRAALATCIALAPAQVAAAPVS